MPAATLVPFTLNALGLMKFNRLRVVAPPPLSRQLTTSTIGYRTGSTPASFEPRTRASEVPPCEPQVGSTSAGEFAMPGAVETSLGTISASLPPTWNWVAVEFTHAAREGEGKAHEIASRKSVIAMLGTRVVMLIPCLRFWLEVKSG